MSQQQQPLPIPPITTYLSATPSFTTTTSEQPHTRMLGPGGIDILSDQDDDHFIDDPDLKPHHFHQQNAKDQIQQRSHTQDLHSFRQSGGLPMPYRDTKTGNIYTIPSSMPTPSGFHYPQVPYQPRSLSLSPQSTFYIGPLSSGGVRDTPTWRNTNMGSTQNPYEPNQHAHRPPFAESTPDSSHAHRCPQCLIPFTRKNDLLRHIKTVHQLSSTQMNVCAVCCKQFARMDSLRRHERICK